MSFFDYLDKHPIISWTAIIVGVVVIIIFAVTLISKGREITIGNFKLGKQAALPDFLSKQARKKIENEGTRIAFAYTGDYDPPSGLKDVRDDFASGKDIVRIQPDECRFDSHFGDCHTVVFQVPREEYSTPIRPVECPLSRRVADYCRNNNKHCILVTEPGKFINISEAEAAFDPRYITTVNFYSKLRETLYMLLYFSPLNEKYL